MMTKHSVHGFTLIELVAIIVLLGILSVLILPRLSGRDDFSDYALRDQLISSFRYAQQRAMYDHTPGVCYSLMISASGLEPQRDGSFFGNIGQVNFSGDYSGVSVSPTVTIFFDGLGNASTGTQASCGGTPVANPLTLTVGATTVDVFPTGFVRGN